MNDKELVSYHSKLVGVTFEGRQAIISVLTGKEPLRVRREKDNEYDKLAVAVDVMFGETWAPIGYIAKDKNTDIAAALDAGESVYIANGGITGGDGKSFGVNIKLEYKKAPVKVAPVPKKALVSIANPTPVETNPMKLLEAVIAAGLGGGVDIKIVATKKQSVKYTSRLLGQTKELAVVNGHKRLEGYLSGSKFPKKFYQEFDEEAMLQKIVEKFGVDKEHVKAMWGLNREASTGYGTAIHAALENYDTYFTLGDKIKKVETFKTKADRLGPNKALSKNPFLKKIVEDFHKKFGGDYIRLSEQFIWLDTKRLCGAIDRLKIIDLDKKIVRIQDFKTDGDVHEKTYQLVDSPFYKLTQGETPTMGKELLDLHWLQLSFYAYILQQYGYTVEGLDVYWLNPAKLAKGVNAWEEFSHDVIDISGAL